MRVNYSARGLSVDMYSLGTVGNVYTKFVYFADINDYMITE